MQGVAGKSQRVCWMATNTHNPQETEVGRQGRHRDDGSKVPHLVAQPLAPRRPSRLRAATNGMHGQGPQRYRAFERPKTRAGG